METKSIERATREPAARGDGASEALAFPLRDPELPPVPFRFLGAAGAIGLAVATLLAMAAHVRALPLFAAVGVVASVAAAWYWVRRERTAARAEAARIPRLELDDRALALVETSVTGETRTPVLGLDRRFGLTLLSSPARRALVLALTHRDGVEFIGSGAPSGSEHVDLLARAVTTPENDMPLGDRIPFFADGDRLLAVARALEARAPGAFDRVFLSDAGMADVVLEDGRLRAGQLDFDLRAPLFWRAYGFQEGSTFASHTFQATQIRQGEREVVLVALAPTGELATPSIVAPPPGSVVQGPLAVEAVQRALARDLRLAHCLVDLPPSRGQRVAVDRLFMPRLRQALDGAPSEVVITTPRPSAPELVGTPPEGVDQLRQSSPDVR